MENEAQQEIIEAEIQLKNQKPYKQDKPVMEKSETLAEELWETGENSKGERRQLKLQGMSKWIR